MKRMTIKINKNDLPKMRIPLPSKTGGFHSSKKGKKGYNRKQSKNIYLKEY